MNIFIVQAHPEPRSFNAALTERAVEELTAAGHEVVVSDLYRMNWDPVSDRRNFLATADHTFFRQQAEEVNAVAHYGFSESIRMEQDKLHNCDALIFQFPLWWFGMPAILKGWVDKVFAMGVAYGGGRWYDRGMFAKKRAMLSLTTGGPEQVYGPDGLNGDIEKILYPINHGILAFTGFRVLRPSIAWSAARVTPEQRMAYLDAHAQRMRELWTDDFIAYPPLSAFDERYVLRRS